MNFTKESFNKLFDNTLLKAYSTTEDYENICRQSVRYGFATVAVNSGVVKTCAELLRGTDVKVTATVGFPLGSVTVESKLFEIAGAIRDGAGEIDYVLNIGKLKEGCREYIKDEMKAIVTLCRENNVISKVIFENCYLTDTEKKIACEIALEVMPDFIKTSTGFGTGAATVSDVRLMKEMVGDKIKVKAAGGVRDLASCMAMIEAGADRIGCSAAAAIADEFLSVYGV